MNRKYPSPILPRQYRPADSGSTYSGIPLQESYSGVNIHDEGFGRLTMTRDSEMSEEKKKATAFETAQQFSQESSFHGIKYVGDTSISKCRRLIWTLFLIGSICFFLYAVIPRVEYYLRNPVRTKISIQYKKPLDFPSVTICNFNMFRKTFVEADPVLRKILNYIFPQTGLPVEKIDFNDPLINATLHKYTSYEILKAGAHTLKGMFKDCHFGHDEIDCSEYFTEHFTDLGICYTFHSAEFIERRGRTLISDASGSDYGLRIRASIQHGEYSHGVSTSAGLKVLIHAPDDMPLVREFGFAIQPGSETFAAVKQHQMSFLPFPYENGRCNDTKSESFRNPLRFFKNYDYSACRMECKLNNTINICNCTFGIAELPKTSFNGRPAFPFCTLAQWINCVKNAEKRYYNDHHAEKRCGCFTPCKVVEYKVQISSALFPGDHIVHEIKGKYNLTEEFIRHNFLDLRVYFEEMNYDFIVQEPDYTWQQLIADIGGQLGFCVGASVLSVYEIVEFISVLFCRLVRKLGRRKIDAKKERERFRKKQLQRMRETKIRSNNGTL
ncbi:acid-sensing ion channel 1A-like isoform X2 [Lineus longissimus]|uniref:acid-sensing ion channel 1A-like isoform X2 n=1 Tax=Lineus longissimus TaxID=88925 RepID=UPI00315D1DBC